MENDGKYLRAIKREEILQQVGKERRRQIRKLEGTFVDTAYSPSYWHALIADYNAWARRMAAMGSCDKARNRYIQIAALAVAAVEALDGNG